MLTFSQKLILLILSLLITINISAYPAYPAKDLTKPIVVTQERPEFRIKLPANQSTGYQWYLCDGTNMNLIQPLGFTTVTEKNSRIGAPGYMQFTLKLLPAAFLVPRHLQLDFVYQRSWEAQPVERRHVIIITAPSAPPPSS